MLPNADPLVWYQTNMADGGEDIFLFGDDFDVILDLLEQDEDIEEEFVTSVENVSIICLLFKWNLLKKCKDFDSRG